MHIYPVNRAVSKPVKNDTARNYRNANYTLVIVGVEPDPSNKEKITNRAKNYWNEHHPYSAGHAYFNFMMEEGEDRVKATYGENYKRLAGINVKYDPENLFSDNQNIKPLIVEAGALS